MSKGRITIPTDKGYVEETREIIKRWGADAIRDCDGTELPDHPLELAEKVYKTYFLARGDNEFAYAHDELLQNIALITERAVAFDKILKIDLMKGYWKEQLRVNEENPKKYWQVIDRTTGKEISEWMYENGIVTIEDAEYMHEYTVSFFAQNLWDATQIYNYVTNGWTCTKDRDIDPVFPEVVDQIKKNLHQWLSDNEDVNVIRFTTFFYHFFLIHKPDGKQKYFDFFGYATSASPRMFDMFERETGESICIEDIVDSGYYSNSCRVPTTKFLTYMDFVEKFVAETMRKFIDIVHSYNKEAMMFFGDNWIGGELYGKHFKDMNLDAVVGSVNSGATLRLLSEIPHVKYREARMLPYFFPDTIPNDEVATEALQSFWAGTRRAIMRKPIDRIGFGGYLALAAKLPKFMTEIERICEEFRGIHQVINYKEPYTSLRLAVLNAWGYKRSWLNHMICLDAPYQKMSAYQGVLEALVGLPVHIEFINFEDVKNGRLKDFDVVLNYGDRGTSFSGDYYWKDSEVTTKIRQFVYEGGGFVGMGEPTAVENGGKFFQLSDVLGVDEELSYSLVKHKWFYEKVEKHFITEDVRDEVDYGGAINNIFANEGAEILDIEEDKYSGIGPNAGHVRMAANSYGKGRGFYMSGMRYNAENTRLLYRALLWAAGKEKDLKKAFATNIYTECHYYPESGKYAVVNNLNEEIQTVFYNIAGETETLTLKPLEICWIEED